MQTLARLVAFVVLGAALAGPAAAARKSPASAKKSQTIKKETKRTPNLLPGGARPVSELYKNLPPSAPGGARPVGRLPPLRNTGGAASF